MAYLNDKVVAFLKQNAIAFSGPDFVITFDEQGAESITTWDVAKLGAQPDRATLDAAYVAIQSEKAKAQTKAQAMALLSQTDWVEMPSVANTANSPHLANYAAFLAYRLALRAIAVDPTEAPSWPSLPMEQWT